MIDYNTLVVLAGVSVLGACADELAKLTDERFAGAKLNERFLLNVTTGIEAVALELNRLEIMQRTPR